MAARSVEQPRDIEEVCALRRVGCFVWHATVSEDREILQWDLVLRDEVTCLEILPLDVDDDETYSEAWRRSMRDARGDPWEHAAQHAVLADESRYARRIHCRDDNGTVRWFWENVVVDEAGARCWNLTGVALEITERGDADRFADVLARAFDQVSGSIIIIDRDGRILAVNRAFEESTGYARDEVIGETASIYAAPDADLDSHETLAAKIPVDEPFDGVLRHKKKSGELFFERQTVSPIRDVAGTITHYVALGQDVTDRVKSEQALRESEERFRVIAEMLPLAIFVDSITNVTGVRYMNSYMMELLGGSPEEVSGRPKEEFYADPKDAESILATLSEHGFVDGYEVLAKKTDGTPFWASLHVRYILYHGEPVVVGAFTDITQEKETARQLQHQVENISMLYEASRALLGVGRESEEVLLARACESAVRHLEPATVWAGLIDPETERLRTVAAHGFTEDFDSLRSRLGREEAVTAAIRDGHTTVMNESDEEAGIGVSVGDGPPIRSIAAVPLLDQDGSVLGILCVQSRTRGDFSDERVQALQSLANLVTLGLRQVHLYCQIERRAEMLEGEVAQTAEELHRAQEEAHRLRLQSTRRGALERIVGASSPMRELYLLMRQASESDVTVLVHGESGTGKELVATAIHYDSRRKQDPFIAVNCAAIPGELVESELFGHERGAFTGAAARRVGAFERAGNGTIFLDEIGDMPLAAQASLLRVLQEGEIQRVGGATMVPVRARVIVSTNRNLLEAVNNGTFRQDLYYRISAFPIDVPPLRERREDVPLLVARFLAQYSHESGHAAGLVEISPEAMEALVRYDWPGNVRELENAIRRIVLLSSSGWADVGDLPSLVRGASDGTAPREPAAEDFHAEEIIPLREIEKSAIADAMRHTRGNIRRAAQALGIGRTTLYRKLRAYDLLPADVRDP